MYSLLVFRGTVIYHKFDMFGTPDGGLNTEFKGDLNIECNFTSLSITENQDSKKVVDFEVAFILQ